ncbi:MAG: TldD/PmbA family protein [Candidatus Aenigmarchaeota archaeon]|nr:TldD/PmbA family protein [Candidatus Aenigmarchaeota archaeon]
MPIRDLMEDVVEILKDTYYGDVRFEKGYGSVVGKNKSEENISSASSNGICIRAFSDNKWYYLGFDRIDKKTILSETKKLVKKIGNKKSNLYLQKPWKLNKTIKLKIDPEDISIEEKLKNVREIFKEIMKNKQIVNCGVGISHSRNETIFMNTEGSDLKQVLPFFRFVITATAKQGKRVEDDYFVIAKQGGYELFSSLDINEKINMIVNNARKMLTSKVLKGGRYDIVVDPDVTGVIAHESFGHGLEADQVIRNRSYLANLKGKKIISELVSIHDNGALENERGFLFFDDEGIKSHDTVLVKNGVLKSFMHDRESAAFMNAKPTGNAKAQDFSRKVYVRMTNTYIEKGDWDVDELIRDTKKGFYLVKCLTGMEDPLQGNLQVITHKAIEIKNGELGDWYKGVGITGKTLEFLSNVDAVGNDFDVRGSGCGKGHEDYVPVSSGGPHMRIRNAIIG